MWINNERYSFGLDHSEGVPKFENVHPSLEKFGLDAYDGVLYLAIPYETSSELNISLSTPSQLCLFISDHMPGISYWPIEGFRKYTHVAGVISTSTLDEDETTRPPFSTFCSEERITAATFHPHSTLTGVLFTLPAYGKQHYLAKIFRQLEL